MSTLVTSQTSEEVVFEGVFLSFPLLTSPLGTMFCFSARGMNCFGLFMFACLFMFVCLFIYWFVYLSLLVLIYSCVCLVLSLGCMS